ncbi:MAG: hypothetical protein LUG98_06870, partial [Tannerellaceae bacterium]|nr:hypothetical protein [Tannerellaceae bacterium]
RGLSNQALGFIPLLAYLLVDNYLDYTLSFIMSISLSLICTCVYQLFAKEKIFQFSLIPSAIILLFYAVSMVWNLDPGIYDRSTSLIEAIMVGVLVIIYFNREIILVKSGKRKYSAINKSILRNSLSEFFYICKLFLLIYLFHLLAVFCFLLYRPADNPGRFGFIFMEYVPILLGIFIIGYEQIRVYLIKETLNKEEWLPILNDTGQVIGNIARSVSERSTKKYRHPLIRIAVMYQGMFYLVKRGAQELVSPNLLDYPVSGYVPFGLTIDEAVQQLMKTKLDKLSVVPRHMLTYNFENSKVKQLISLFILKLEHEEQVDHFRGGKLWSVRQIEENLSTHVFSEYFTNEFAYLQSTVLLTEGILEEIEKEHQPESSPEA